VIVDSDGQLGTSNSSRRFKKDIKPMDQSSEVILALKPVTFHYKNADTKKAENTPQFGLIAEDVAEVNPDLVVRDADGQPLTVRYDAVNAMLLNEFLKEHKKSRGTTDQHHATKLQNGEPSGEQAAQIQKVSAQLEVNKPAPQIVSHEQLPRYQIRRVSFGSARASCALPIQNQNTISKSLIPFHFPG
jgi:hypothetical protein